MYKLKFSVFNIYNIFIIELIIQVQVLSPNHLKNNPHTITGTDGVSNNGEILKQYGKREANQILI